jgi:hypothetical protein
MAAGCPGRILHDLRRSAVRNMEQRDIPRSGAMKITGHKTESVYRRYAIQQRQRPARRDGSSQWRRGRAGDSGRF